MLKLTSWIFRILLLIPFVWLGWEFYSDQIGADPAKYLNHKMGQWALYYLLINLVIGALISYSVKFPKFLRFLLINRRWLGVTTFFYLIFHFLLYLTLEGFEKQAFTQILDKTYLLLGSSAGMILLILAMTSNNFSVKKLGAKNWKRLHRSVYVASALITVHVLLIEKADLIKYGILFSLLWVLQLPRLFYIKSFKK